MGCDPGKVPAGGLQCRGTDTNYALLKSSLDDAQKRIPHPDFILYPAICWPTSGRADTTHWRLGRTSTIHRPTTCSRPRRSAFWRTVPPEVPGIVVAPTLGNEDSYCGDYRIEPDGPFLSMFAETWAPLLHLDVMRTEGLPRHFFPRRILHDEPAAHDASAADRPELVCLFRQL